MRCCLNEIHTGTCVTIDVMKNRIGFSGCQLFWATLNNKLMFAVAAIYVNCTLLAIGGNDDELRLSSILMTVRPHLVLVDSCLYHRSRIYIYIVQRLSLPDLLFRVFFWLTVSLEGLTTFSFKIFFDFTMIVERPLSPAASFYVSSFHWLRPIHFGSM